MLSCAKIPPPTFQVKEKKNRRLISIVNIKFFLFINLKEHGFFKSAIYYKKYCFKK